MAMPDCLAAHPAIHYSACGYSGYSRMLDPLPDYQELGSWVFTHSLDCPVGTWRARLIKKAWGKQRTILLYLCEIDSDRKYCLCVFDATFYAPADRGINFRNSGEPGQAFELTTGKTRTGRTSFLSARLIPAPEGAALPEPGA